MNSKGRGYGFMRIVMLELVLVVIEVQVLSRSVIPVDSVFTSVKTVLSFRNQKDELVPLKQSIWHSPACPILTLQQHKI